MDIDVKTVMLKLLERQKEYVLADLDNYSEALVAVFTADNQSYVAFPKFEDEASKIAEYTAIVQKAKEKGAVLLITVNNARTKRVKTAGELEDCRWSDLCTSDSRSCILLTASGPGLQSCSIELGYEIKDGRVEFDQAPELMDKIQLNLLPDWPAEPQQLLN